MIYRNSCSRNSRNLLSLIFRSSEDGHEPKSIPKANVNLDTSNTSGGSADLLGLGFGGGPAAPAPEVSNTNGNGFTQEPVTNNLSK